MKILHQCGHHTTWNINSLKNNIGNGLIFSPVHQSQNAIEGIEGDIQKKSFFDPQFYVPNSQKSKLLTYPFFPNQIMDNNFDTTDFYPKAYQVAVQCLEFQINNKFSSVIIPTRYFSEMHTDYTERQKKFTVEPFINALSEVDIGEKKIFLSLSVKAPMVEDEGFCEKLLNWITSYQEIDGVYLMIDFDEPLKQVNDFNKLFGYMNFIQILKEAELDIICGYANTEGLLYALLEPQFITMGAYENTRKFSVTKFLDEPGGRGPAPRLYMPKLLNWVRYQTLEEIREDHPNIWSKIYTSTDFSESLINSQQKPHFTKPDIYQHHFEAINSQYKELMGQNIEGKISMLGEWIREAKSLYREVSQANIILYDENCSDGHLNIWNRILNKFS